MSARDLAGQHLEARLAREQRDRRLPSIAAAVVRGGDIAWSGAAGAADGRADGTPATADTQYRIGSITKSMVAVGVMRLVAEGHVALTDPIRQHLPELDTSLDRVSVLALLGQTGGLHAETDGPWWERSPGLTWEELLPSIRLAHDPGRRFHYTNVGFAVLGRLIENHCGRGWFDVLADEVFGPLGMTRTTYAAAAPSAPGLAVHPYADLRHVEPEHDTGAMAPAGQIWSTVEDLGRWARFLSLGDERVLPQELLDSMQVPGAVWDTPGEPWTRCYGLGLDIFNRDGRRFVGHGGSMPGFQSLVIAEPGTGAGVAVATNSTSGPSGGLARELLTRLDEHDPIAPSPWHTSTADPDLAGAWFWGPRPFEVALRPGGILELGPAGGGGRWSRFLPGEDGTWIGADEYFAGEVLRVHGSGPGAYLDLASFRLTRTPYALDGDIPGGIDPNGWHA